MKQRAFTLAELLIALVILGVIATFTIPKVLTSQQDSRFNSIAKEATGMVSQAYQAYQLNNTSSSLATMGFKDLTPYMNYVRYDTSSTVDSEYNTVGTRTCGTSSDACLFLHNGASLRYRTTITFGTTDSTSTLWFSLDPDGIVTTDGSATTPGKAIQVFLYMNGRIVNWGNTLNGTMSGGTSYGPNPSHDPPWFSWS